MESAEMSLNANAVGGFAGMDVHKKALMGDQSELESGYVSSWSISHSHGTPSDVLGMGLSQSGKFSSSSFKRSLDLETISENAELKELQETPTTRSIRHLNAFHINTPQNTRDQLETTPKKANYFANPRGTGNSSNKKARNIRWSLDKSLPKSQSLGDRTKSFTSQLSIFESIDENYENIFNDEAENHACNQSIGVSPIKHNLSSANVQLPEKSQQCIQRHASGIESSTPKNSFKRVRTQSIVKPKAYLVDALARDNLIRKTQSFSPAKRSALRETNFQLTVEPNELKTQATIEPYNPARKVLEFTSQKFERLIQPSDKVTTRSSPAKPITPQKAEKHTPLKRLNTQKSRLVKEFTRKKITRTTTIRQTPIKAAASLDESDILAALANDNETDTMCKTEANASIVDTDDNLMDISDLSMSASMQTPSTHKQQLKSRATMAISDTPIRNDFVKQNIREEANRTPAKRFQKSTSHNYLSVKTSPEKEKFDIVYGHLPCTPPKNRQHRALKRSASVFRSDSPSATVGPAAKRKLYSERTRMYYNGFEQLDILTYFHKVDKPELAERILSYLPDKDLQIASLVCKSWRKCVNENPKFKLRRRQFVKSLEITKENVGQQFVNRLNKTENITTITNKTMNSSCGLNNNNTIPLHVHNKNFKALIEKPITVSPSKRRFDEHQQIVENLRPGQSVLYCPRCNGTSVVHPATGNDSRVQRRSPRRQLQQSYSLDTFSIRSTKNKRNYLLLTPVVISEYAECTKKNCGYEFCTNCYCARHQNAKCTKRPLGSSPKSDEDTPHRCEPSRNTKRNLRRLGRLAF